MPARASAIGFLLVALVSAGVWADDGNAGGQSDGARTTEERIDALRDAIREERAALEAERERRRDIERELERVRSALERARGEIETLEERVERGGGSGSAQ